MERKAAADLDSVNNTCLKICSIELQLNSSFRLQCSLSSLESESDLSLAFERDLGEPTDCDELPAFEIRAFSPHGRTPSPIDDLNVSDIEATPKALDGQQQRSPGRQNNPEFVALHEINAQISAPNDNNAVNESIAGISRANSLETIFEGVFLNTPPRETHNKSVHSASNPNSANRSTPKRSRANLMELVAMNRLASSGGGKENKSPSKERPNELT
ncbi:hypothetical protein KR093_006474 [Drosophila rubida]|uniref:Uncharacterized protein n=1 Tax=Drosophila rubida TaxID=30044 RepID=A0AAD4PL50_9MUSC|nr:hypothetical protein KR093_006474 [Drosophila rubida]